MSWLDHILTTTSGYSILTDACVKTGFITSDHIPLCFTISIDNLHIPVSSSGQTSHDRQSYNWCGASDNDIDNEFILLTQSRIKGETYKDV